MSPQTETLRPTVDVRMWIVEARSGNREALGRLLDECRRYLLSLANRQLAPVLRVKMSPSDLVQDTLLEAGRDFPCFRGATEEELLGWLRGILLHNASNARRRFETGKRRMQREVVLDEAQLRDAVEQSETPSGQMRKREQNEQLERALENLPEHYRLVLHLHVWEGLTFAQIAARSRSTAEAVRKRWLRAARELVKLLNNRCESA